MKRLRSIWDPDTGAYSGKKEYQVTNREQLGHVYLCEEHLHDVFDWIDAYEGR